MDELTDDNDPPEGNSHLFKPGQSGNPAGRPKGARNRLSEAFLEALEADWAIHGKAVIEAVRQARPQDYLKVVAGLMPKDVNLNVDDPYSDLTDEQLRERMKDLIQQLEPVLYPSTDSASGSLKIN